jgi:hypothetical protein
LANPVRKRENDEYTFKIKLDVWYNGRYL